VPARPIRTLHLDDSVLLVAQCLSGFTHFVIVPLVEEMLDEGPAQATDGRRAAAAVEPCTICGRGLHSFTFRLNVSAFCGIGGAFRCWSCGVVGGVKGVVGGV
jgi:hypothetical protein